MTLILHNRKEAISYIPRPSGIPHVLHSIASILHQLGTSSDLALNLSFFDLRAYIRLVALMVIFHRLQAASAK